MASPNKWARIPGMMARWYSPFWDLRTFQRKHVLSSNPGECCRPSSNELDCRIANGLSGWVCCCASKEKLKTIGLTPAPTFSRVYTTYVDVDVGCMKSNMFIISQ
jgi:hypothetical protein